MTFPFFCGRVCLFVFFLFWFVFVLDCEIQEIFYGSTNTWNSDVFIWLWMNRLKTNDFSAIFMHNFLYGLHTMSDAMRERCAYYCMLSWANNYLLKTKERSKTKKKKQITQLNFKAVRQFSAHSTRWC